MDVVRADPAESGGRADAIGPSMRRVKSKPNSVRTSRSLVSGFGESNLSAPNAPTDMPAVSSARAAPQSSHAPTIAPRSIAYAFSPSIAFRKRPLCGSSSNPRSYMFNAFAVSPSFAWTTPSW